MTSAPSMTREQVQEHARRIAAEAGAEVRLDEPLAPHVSMRLGGPVAALVLPASPQALALVARRLIAESVPYRILGGGSNLLVADAGLDFVALSAASASGESAWDGTTVRAPGGMPLAQLVSEAMKRGMAGLEWAAGLPGSVGGAVAGNAGAFGGDMAANVAEVVLMSPEGRVRTHVPGPGDFRYRGSFVRPGEIILEVALSLAASTPEAVRDETNRINRARAGSQPKGGHSSGCIFKNPPGGHAGKLIDECGLKGSRVGGAVVSPAHGNFIVNDGTATASDVIELIRRVRAEVARATGVTLELEVQVWPSRDAATGEAP